MPTEPVVTSLDQEAMTCGLQEVRPRAPKPASCTDSTGHGTDCTHRAGIIWRAVPRNVPRPKLPRPLILLLCVTPARAPRLRQRERARRSWGPAVYRPLPYP